MLDIPSISAVVAAIGVLVGVTLAYLEVRTLVRQRQTDLIMRLHSKSTDKEAMEAFLKIIGLEFDDYNDYVKKYGLPLSENPTNVAFHAVCTFFEGIGVLLHRKLVDAFIHAGIADLFAVEMIWKKVKPMVEGIKKQFNEPCHYEWFEYLYNEKRVFRRECKDCEHYEEGEGEEAFCSYLLGREFPDEIVDFFRISGWTLETDVNGLGNLEKRYGKAFAVFDKEEREVNSEEKEKVGLEKWQNFQTSGKSSDYTSVHE